MRPDFRLRGNLRDSIHGRLLRLAVVGVDFHRAVVFDVDLGTRLVDDAANRCATLADDVADLVRMDLQRGDGRCVLRQIRTRLADHLVHFAKDEHAAFVRLLKCCFHDLFGDPVDLDVHLQRGNTFRRTSHLEVHVAEVVLVAEDVGQHRVFVGLPSPGPWQRRQPGRLIGTPASISASDDPHTLAIELDPFDSVISETRRIVYGNAS